MKPDNGIDVLEQDIANYNSALLDILLIDRTTGKNIVWASDDYAYMGDAYGACKQITPSLIIGKNTRIIQPRIAKAQQDQLNRTRNKAEVFTPSWVCNAQNNLIDEAWFGRKDVFNTSDGTTWQPIEAPIRFPDDKQHTWKKYVDANRMEITCGEAPYLVSRYDTTTGVAIPIKNRIGLLDRKLRIVAENTEDEEDWWKWMERAFQSIYGYEFQGDNLLLARENLLYTFVDYIRFYLRREPTLREMKRIATIVSWNLWQMDGTTYTIPYSKIKENEEQMMIFDMFSQPADDDYTKPCCIKDWRSKVILEFRSLLKGGK
ncbi:MAG: restriction endonuclease subunit M [Planctomycetia bacterium]|nr:restriction endonuclease subunit M [Planctomycetia bacterium]